MSNQTGFSSALLQTNTKAFHQGFDLFYVVALASIIKKKPVLYFAFGTTNVANEIN